MLREILNNNDIFDINKIINNSNEETESDIDFVPSDLNIP